MKLFGAKTSLRLALLTSCLAVTACEETIEVTELPPRSVKTVTVEAFTGEQSRRLAGIVRAQTISELAFEVSGRVVELAHDIGETVTPGEIIARLDKEPYELRIRTAEASLVEAQAVRRDAQSKYTQQKTLFDREFATKTALDTAEANLETALSGVIASQAQLDLAKRDLAQTELRAPFAGSVGARYVDPFSEVTSGQRIYQINSDGQNEILVSLPENLIQNISIGATADIEFITQGLSLTGRVTELATQPNAANSYEMTVALDSQPAQLRPGMTAQVTFSFGSTADQTSYLLPVTAIQALPQENMARVYVFLPEQGTVQKREVRMINAIGNQVEVVGELAIGDLLVSAGTSFLSDGMEVRAMTGRIR